MRFDATDDDAQAVDAFSQAAGHLGTNAVAIYSEVMHEGVELLVRSRGSQVLFGATGRNAVGRILPEGLAGRAWQIGRKKRPEGWPNTWRQYMCETEGTRRLPGEAVSTRASKGVKCQHHFNEVAVAFGFGRHTPKE